MNGHIYQIQKLSRGTHMSANLQGVASTKQDKEGWTIPEAQKAKPGL